MGLIDESPEHKATNDRCWSRVSDGALGLIMRSAWMNVIKTKINRDVSFVINDPQPRYDLQKLSNMRNIVE